MTTPQTSDCAKLLSPELLYYFHSTLGHKEFTAVQQDAQQQRRWGEYYFGDASQPSSQLKGRKSWVLETIYAVNQMIPSFNELFDQVPKSGTKMDFRPLIRSSKDNFQETFYVFALCVVAASVFAVFVMARVFKPTHSASHGVNSQHRRQEHRHVEPIKTKSPPPIHPCIHDCLFKKVFDKGGGVTAAVLSHRTIYSRGHFNEAPYHFQQCTIPYFLAKHCDCVVQAPTGSGKTLAYLLPTMQIVCDRLKSRSGSEKGKLQISALVIVPGRELVEQVGKLFKTICDETGLRLMKLVGGVKRSKIEKITGEGSGHCIIIATPGRLQTLLDSVPALKTALKALEVLIIDEADRFSHSEFVSTMTSILASLPKQRRTGLFSATQAKEAEELMRYGLRNPVRISVRSTQPAEIHEGAAANKEDADESLVTPSELTNYHWEVPAEKKLFALVQFLNKVAADSKVLLFLCSAAGVDYLAQILPPLLNDSGHKVMALHRKKKGKREKILTQFRSSTEKCVLLSTDLMARGVDVVDIDWVVQYDLPKHSSLLVHRGGRSGRNGRLGQSLFLLAPEETAYIDFVSKHEGVELTRWEPPFQLRDKAAEKLRRQVQDMAIGDRRVLEAGSAAFVSFVQAYCRHDCQLVCRLKDLDLVGVANSFGLLRLPRMKELKQRPDLADFQPRTDINTGEIAYADAKLEAQRQAAKAEKRRRKDPAVQQLVDGTNDGVSDRDCGRKRPKKAPDWKEFDTDSKLLKKFKRGKMTRGELDGLLL